MFMIEIYKKVRLLLIISFVFLTVTVFFHSHNEIDKKHDHNCIICVFVKNISNLTFNLYTETFVTTIFFVILPTSAQTLKFYKLTNFFSRAPPIVL